MTDAELLTAAIAASGLSVRKFAALIGRNGRTVFAWKAKGPALTLSASVRDQLWTYQPIGTHDANCNCTVCHFGPLTSPLRRKLG